MTVTHIPTNNTLEATATPTGPIGTTTRGLTQPLVATSSPETDQGFANALGGFLARGNVFEIGGRRVDAGVLTRVLTAPLNERMGRLRGELGLPTLSYDDFRRLADDVMTHNAASTNQVFAITLTEAQRTGVVETLDGMGHQVDVNFGASGNVTVDRHAVRPDAPARNPTDDVTMFRNALRSAPLAQRAVALMNTGSSAAAGTPARELFELVNHPNIRDLSPEIRESILRTAVGAADTTGGVPLLQTLRHFIGSGEFRALPAGSQHALLELMNHGGSQGVAVLDRLLSAPGSMAQVARLMNTPIRSEYAANAPDNLQLAVIAMTHVLQPGGIDQSLANTCTVTSASAALARTNPTEYLRLVADLMVGPAPAHLADGTVLPTVAAQAAPLVRQDPYGFALSGDSRDVVERVMQTALMAAAVPGYNPVTDTAPVDVPFGETPTPRSGGLDSAHLRQLMQRMFPTQDWCVYGGPNPSAPIADQAHAVFDYLAQTPRPEGPTLLGLRWNQGESNFHELQFVSMDGNGNIMLRNPHGANQEPPISPALTIPPGDRNGMVILSRASFEAAFDSCVTPRPPAGTRFSPPR